MIVAGRKNLTSLLVAYLDLLVQDCTLHEVHMWDYAREDEDRAWLKEVAAHPAFRLMTDIPQGESPKWGHMYRYYHSSSDSGEPRFKPSWPHATSETTVLMKIDDDIIYIDTSRFANFTEWVRTHPEKFLVHANVVNNGVAAYYQGLHFKRIIDDFPELELYPYTYGTPGLGGALLDDDYLSSNLLWMFVMHPRMFSWTDPDVEDCPMFAIPQEQLPRTKPRPPGQGRFSLNFFGARWARWGEVNDLVEKEKDDDEHALTTVATKQQPKFAECIYVPFNVVHYSFDGRRQPPELIEVFRDQIPRTGNQGDVVR